MPTDQTPTPPANSAATVVDGSGGEPEDWAAAIALTVAATLDPSAAFAYCFGNAGLLDLQHKETARRP